MPDRAEALHLPAEELPRTVIEVALVQACIPIRDNHAGMIIEAGNEIDGRFANSQARVVMKRSQELRKVKGEK